MTKSLNLNDYLAHVIELGSSDEFESKNAKFNLRVLNSNDQNLCKSFFQLLSGINLNNKPIEIFSAVKKIKPRKNIGYFGLSTTALASDIPFETFHECGFNFGCLIKKDSKDIRVLAASPFDVNSSCLYNSAEDSHRISFRIETKSQNTNFWNALIKHPNVEIERVQRPSFDEPEKEICYARFNERDLLNNPIKSSVSDAIEDVKRIGDFNTFRDLNYDNSPWNEVVICAKLQSVSGLFFSGDHSQIEEKIYSNEVFRDFQLINTMILAGMLSKGIDYDGKFKIQKNYPIYEYDSKNLSLTKINLEYEKKLILEKYDDLPAEAKKLINYASDLDVGFGRF